MSFNKIFNKNVHLILHKNLHRIFPNISENLLNFFPQECYHNAPISQISTNNLTACQLFSIDGHWTSIPPINPQFSN